MYKIFLIMFLITNIFSKTLVVDDDYNGIWGDICEHGTHIRGRRYYDYSTIEAALEDAEDGDIIKICPGNYNESNLVVDKNLIIQSTQTTNVSDVVIYDDTFPIFKIEDNIIFNGFEIKQNSTTQSAIIINDGNDFNFTNLNILSKGSGIIQNSDNAINMYVDSISVLIDNINNDNLYIKQSNQINIINSTFNGGKYGVYIEKAINVGEIKNNIFKNAAYKGLQIFNEQLEIGYKVENNCFENGENNNILSKDKNGYFNANYYDDWSGSGTYEIPDIPKYDFNPLDECLLSLIRVDVLLNYRMDECEWDGSNADVKDSSENSYNGTSKNGANTETNTTLEGMIGRVGNLIDGNYAIRADIDLPSQYTITMWLKFPLNDLNHQDFNGNKYFNIADLAGSNSDYIYFRNDEDEWSLCIYGDTYECHSYNPQNLNGWHFVTFKISNDDTKFYVDNELKLTFNEHPNDVQLGLLFNSDYDSSDDNIPNGQSIGAYVDEFKIFSGIVSDNDLETIYNNELNRKNYDGTKRDNIICDTYEQCYSTTFSSQSEIDQNWSIIKNQNYTPQIVNQKLRLTTNSGDISTGVTLKNRVFKANGTKFKIRFKHYAYNGSSSKGADGVAVVFSDYSITPVAGAFGGSLGYAQKTNIEGFAGGWIGIGLDEYGNYSNPTEGRVGGPGFIEQAVAIRGSYLEDYKYLTGTNTLTPPISDGDSSAASPGYTYEIRVDTTNENQTIISVYRNTGNGDELLIDKYEYNTTNTPDYFKFSFTGSTGGENNIHEIDDLEIWALDCNSTFVNPEENNYLFDVKEISRNDKNITTKIVNKNFDLEIFVDKNFTGTVCSSVVDSDDKNISNWFKNYFNDTNNSSLTLEGNPVYKVSRASKDNKIKIVWLKNQDSNCPLNQETNHTLSTDNFAVRPKKFDIINYPTTIKAGEEFNITFRALDENGNISKDYNETDSFSIDVIENKIGCLVGNLELNVSFINGEANTTAKYSEIGDINLTIKDNSFANVDLDDTDELQRLIEKRSVELNSKVYTAKTVTKFFDNLIYDDKNLTNYAEINTTIQLLDKDGNIVKNFDKDCYASDINISYQNSNNIIDSFKGIYEINGVEENDSNFEKLESNFTIKKEMFVKGETNSSIKFNIYKDRKNPISIVDLNFSKTLLYFNDINTIENLNQQLSFYYLRVYGEDIYTTDINSSTILYILVYDKNKNHFNNELLLNWFVASNYNLNDLKLLGYNTSYTYDSNISDGFEVNITKVGYDFNLSVYNPNKDSFSIIHLKTPYYLWYSKYSDYNDSLYSACFSHYCIEYNYKDNENSTIEVGSGKFEGSESNITIPKRKRFGIKIYR